MTPHTLTKLVACGLTLSLILTSCGHTTPGLPTSQSGAQHYAYVGQVAMGAAATSLGLETLYHGHVLAAHPEKGYALMGFNQLPTKSGLSAQDLLTVEPNNEIFTAGGRRTAWMTGRRTVWMMGTYQIASENSAAFDQIGLKTAQGIAPALGKGVKVAVIDTGLDLNHPAFAGSLAPASEWKDFVDGDNIPQDSGQLGTGGYGHGTAVASIILQVAPNATILPLRVLDADGGGDIQSVAQAIDWAVAKGAQIINLSLGSDQNSATVNASIAYAASQGVQVIASAGNDNASTIDYPANNANNSLLKNYMLSVGSVDSQDNKSDFSNYSANVRVSAPGENITTAAPNNQMASWSGTSMSAPLVAGALALAYGQPSANLLNSRNWDSQLENSAANIYGADKNAAYINKLGKGRLFIPAFLNSGL